MPERSGDIALVPFNHFTIETNSQVISMDTVLTYMYDAGDRKFWVLSVPMLL